MVEKLASLRVFKFVFISNNLSTHVHYDVNQNLSTSDD